MALKGKPRRIRTLTTTLVATVVGVDSDYDAPNRAAFQYRDRHVYPYLKRRGFDVRSLHGPLARRHYVAAALRQPAVDYVTGVGHGLHDLYTGDHGDEVLKVGAYHPDEARGKIIHLLSCQTARELGPDLVRNGCRAFFGYDENFVFYPRDADQFFECDAEIDKAFADGLGARRVYARVRRIFDARIAELRAAGKLYVAAELEYNRDHLRCPSSGGPDWGDESAAL